MPRSLELLTQLSAVDLRLREEDDLGPGSRRPLEERREALRRQVSGMLLAVYDALDRAGRRPPVAALAGATCGGCHMHLPPQLAYEVRYGAQLRHCPHCRRLLHAAPQAAEGARGSAAGR